MSILSGAQPWHIPRPYHIRARGNFISRLSRDPAVIVVGCEASVISSVSILPRPAPPRGASILTYYRPQPSLPSRPLRMNATPLLRAFFVQLPGRFYFFTLFSLGCLRWHRLPPQLLQLLCPGPLSPLSNAPTLYTVDSPVFGSMTGARPHRLIVPFRTVKLIGETRAYRYAPNQPVVIKTLSGMSIPSRVQYERQREAVRSGLTWQC